MKQSTIARVLTVFSVTAAAVLAVAAVVMFLRRDAVVAFVAIALAGQNTTYAIMIYGRDWNAQDDEEAGRQEM